MQFYIPNSLFENEIGFFIKLKKKKVFTKKNYLYTFKNICCKCSNELYIIIYMTKKKK